MVTIQKKPLGHVFKPAIRASKFKTQANVAKELGLPEPILSDYLNSKRTAPDELVVRMADILGVRVELALLAATAARCERGAYRAEDSKERQNLRRAFASCLELMGRTEATRDDVQEKDSPYVSLEAFPHLGSGQWTILVGDRREKPPEGLGDLLALSVSSCDLMFLPSLGLEPGTIVRSDKILKVAQDLDLRRLLQCNILAIGSPAVSLATREILHGSGATFLFNIGERHHTEEGGIYSNIPAPEVHNANYLEEFVNRAEVKDKVDALLATFRKNGFVDPVRFKDIRGRAIPRNKDYAIVALARNPWSKEHIACICAGVHGPGTAGAVQMLSNPAEFAKRPWGGVMTVQVSDQARWEERFSHLNPKWETREYSPERYLEDLSKMIEDLEKPGQQKRYKEMEISEQRLKAIKEFAEKKLMRPSGIPNFTND